MRKTLGVARSKLSIYQDLKLKQLQRRNRFQTPKDEDDSISSRDIVATRSELFQTRSSTEADESDTPYPASQIFHIAQQNLNKARTIQQQISQLAKNRLHCLRENQNIKTDQNVSKLSTSATQNVLTAQKCLIKISRLPFRSEIESKFNANLERALAQNIREQTKSIRQQQKEYYSMISSLQSAVSNAALKLTDDQIKTMSTGDQLSMQMLSQTSSQDKKIVELVASINKLSVLYKEMNQLVITQGTIIDRIDCNIQATYKHTTSAVQHLQSADSNASSPFADRLIKMLAVMIILMAVVLGLKWMH